MSSESVADPGGDPGVQRNPPFLQKINYPLSMIDAVSV